MIEKKIDRFNEKIYILKLKNGMQVHILPKDDPYYTTYVEVSLPYGALDLTYKVGEEIKQNPYGTAHFLEHKIFAMPDGDAFAKFSMLGVDANAMTSYNQTSYLFVATQNVMEALDYLMNMIDTPYFTLENVENEKGIISEELKMYLDDPNTVMQNQLMENMYFNHPLRYDIGGSLESIKEITPEILSDVYTHFYNPSNRLLVIAGKVDLKKIKQFFALYDLTKPKKYDIPKTIIGKEPKKIVVKHEERSMPIGIDKLMIGIKLHPKRLDKRLQAKKEMAMTMLLNMLLGSSSSMYESLLEKELINQSFYVHANFEKKAENIMVYAESKKIKKLRKILVDFLIDGAKTFIQEQAFARYQKVYLGQFVFALNHLETKAYLYGRFYHLGLSLFEIVDVLRDISFQDIKDALDSIQKRYISTLVFKKA